MNITKQKTLDAWKEAIRIISKHGNLYLDTNDRETIEVLNLSVNIKEPSKDITRPIEIMRKSERWIYPSLDEIESIILTKDLAPAYSYSYGPRIFNHNNFNQIDEFVIPLLKEDPSSRRAIVTLWNPQKDSNPLKKNMPGLLLIDFKLRNQKLNITSYVRSNDFFFGWPANVYQVYTLAGYVAKELGVDIGEITTFSSSAHIFKENLNIVKDLLDNLTDR